ncbi:DUF169 domain-containing protein [Thermosulfuriphilus sp.]
MFAQWQEMLFKNLKLYHYPVGIKFHFEEEDFSGLRVDKTCKHRLTFCQFVAFVRMSGYSTKVSRESISCVTAADVFGFRQEREKCLKALKKFFPETGTAESFYATRPRLAPRELKGISLYPLEKLPFPADVVLIVCDTLQAGHLLDDTIAGLNQPTLSLTHKVNGAFCATAVSAYQSGGIELSLACPGAYTSGKMERGEIILYFPWSIFEKTMERLEERVNKQGASLLPGSRDYVGLDVCGNCPLVIFK